MTHFDRIHIQGARVHNLKDVSLSIPRNKMVVFTGLSGSGKSSLAFDTLFAEGQRRYMESLSAYARQFLDKLDKPDVDRIDGLSPAISIDQKSSPHNPRSTVGTTTEIYDYFRVLFSSIGVPHCPTCKKTLQRMSVQEIVAIILERFKDRQVLLMAPLIRKKKGEHLQLFEELRQKGFVRVRVNGTLLRLDEAIVLDRHKQHTIEIVVDRVLIDESDRTRLSESVETCLTNSDGQLLISDTDSEQETLFSERMTCPPCNISFPELSPRLFSFNSPLGACEQCNGLGTSFDFDSELVIVDAKGPLAKATGKILNLDGTVFGQKLAKVGADYGFSMMDSFDSLSVEQQSLVLHGIDTEKGGGIRRRRGSWEGLIPHLRRRYRGTRSSVMRFWFRSYMYAKPCSSCKGTRLSTIAQSVTVGGQTIVGLTDMTIDQLLLFFKSLSLKKKAREIAQQVLKEINERLRFLNTVGLDYLTLSRQSMTLSGGEYQRIRLATQIGSGLTGVLYVLDEPSIGLHQRDNQRLIKTLCRLRDLGNTLVIVEHDEEMIRTADHVVDIGPGAGRKGGDIVYSGDFSGLLNSTLSETAKYLTHEKTIPIPSKRRDPKDKGVIILEGVTAHNLKNITVQFPLGRFICVTGVSGSGKSTLIQDVFYPILKKHFFKSQVRPGPYQTIKGLDHIDKVITIDQSPIGRTPRSNPATYVGVWTPIRELFSKTTEARIRGFKPGRFSFNVKGGRCESCEGAGVVKIEMHFLSDVYVTCETCKGQRFNEQTLAVRYKGYRISDVLHMTVNEASAIFSAIPAIARPLKTLQDVGLGYIQVGQSATTLSGGEAQRVKLAKELSKRSTGKTVYLLDEPTTGLHFADIQQLLDVLNRLVDGGNTVLVIEHNLDVIKMADHIIDLGPGGGCHGGQVVCEGTPEQVAQEKNSYTGQFLGDYLALNVVR